MVCVLYTTDKQVEGNNIGFKVIIPYMMVNTHLNNEMPVILKEMLMRALANNL